MLNTSEDEKNFVTPFNFFNATKKQSANRIKEITPWVHWIRTIQALDVDIIPNCWMHHGALLLELDAAYAAHQIYFDEENSGTGPLEWHYSWWQCRNKLQEFGKRTKCGEVHQDDQIRVWP